MVLDNDLWEHVENSNKKRAEENIKGWAKMAEQRQEFLQKLIATSEALTTLSEFIENYPTDFVTLQVELQKAIEYTAWSIKECKMNVGWAKKRLRGSSE